MSLRSSQKPRFCFLAAAFMYGFVLVFVPCAANTTLLKNRIDAEDGVKKEISKFLNGRPLRVGVIVDVPFVYWKGPGRSKTLGGISVDQMESLAKKYDFGVRFIELEGTYDNVIAKIGGQVGSKDTNNSNDVDIGIQAFTASGTRSMTARLTASPLRSDLVFIRKKAPFLRNFESVFQAFTLWLWVSLFAILFFLAANLAFVDMMRVIWPSRRQVDPTTGQLSFLSTVRTFQKIIKNDKRKVGRLFWNQVFNLGSLLFGQLPISPSDDAPSRVLYILFKAFAFGLAAFYTALLVNQFQAKTDDAFLSLEKFCNDPQKDGVTLQDIFVGKGTSFQAHFLNFFDENADSCPHISDDIIKRFDESVPGGGDNLCQDSDTCAKLVTDGDVYATLTDEAEANWKLSHGECNTLEIVGNTGGSAATTWILPLDGSYGVLAQAFSNAILLARDDGSFDKIARDAINKDGCKADDLSRVTIKNVTGFLVPMAVMYIVAWTIQLFKCARATIPCFRRRGHGERPLWGTDPSICNCRLLDCDHVSHAPLSNNAQLRQHNFSAVNTHGTGDLSGAVIVRPLRNTVWKVYSQRSSASRSSDCPSVC